MLQNLTQLHLSYNSLNGTIPSWVFSLPLLYSLSLDHNRFSGLPNKLKTNPALEVLYLSHNQLSGSIPQSLWNLTNLSFLGLSSNNITVDAGIKITFPNVGDLHLSTCELKDFLHFLRNVKILWSLDISNNKIRGQIPDWFCGMRWDNLWYLNLPQFHYYNLGYLDLKFNSLHGPLPSSICNMKKLEFLDLSCNNFSNSIPSCLGSMANLTVLDLRRNNFTGSLPPLCAQSTSLRTMVLNGNQFKGPVPMSLLKCDGLEVLDVGNNVINDTFPASLGTLQVLQVLILKSNKCHGPISTRQKLCFPRLRIFDLSHNELVAHCLQKFFQNFKEMIKQGEFEYMKPQFHSEIGDRMVEDSMSFEIEGLVIEQEIVCNEVYKDSVRLVIKGNDKELERITLSKKKKELERISTIVTAIGLSSNHFEDVIPKALMDLGSLWLLNLSHNNIKGDIPMELGQLNKLEALMVSLPESAHWKDSTGIDKNELSRVLKPLSKSSRRTNSSWSTIQHI